jgi:hypothetical protein
MNDSDRVTPGVIIPHQVEAIDTSQVPMSWLVEAEDAGQIVLAALMDFPSARKIGAMGCCVRRHKGGGHRPGDSRSAQCHVGLSQLTGSKCVQPAWHYLRRHR